MNPDAVVVILIGFAGLGLIPAAIAQSKGRSFGLWWLYGIFFWIIALIHSLLLAPEGAALDNKAIAAGNLKMPPLRRVDQA